MAETATSRPPRHLKADGKRLWLKITADFVLETHHLAVLQTACESLDRSVQARNILDAQGLTTLDTKGILRAHPCVAIERDNRILMLRALRELSLDASGPAEEHPRPAQIAGGRRYA